MSDDEPMWTSDDVAKFLQVSRSWVEHAAPSGVIPSVMIGRLRRFRPDDIRKISRDGLPVRGSSKGRG
jgi:excisionase family DNA binding protein